MADLPGPHGTVWTGDMLGRDLARQTPESTASKMLAEKRNLNERTKLSWDPKKFPVKGEAKFVGGTVDDEGNHTGGVCLSLPYVLIDRKYYIQNCRIFKTNGQELTLQSVYDLENGSPLYLRVADAFQIHLDQAVVHDPNLCKHCRQFQAKDAEDMLQHIIDIHPDVVARMAGISVEPAADEARVEGGTDKVAPYCETCDRTFKNAGGLRLHRLKVHDRAA